MRRRERWAEARHAKSKRASLVENFLNPFWRFFRDYVLRLGLLDGWGGLAIALIGANNARQKYLQLWMLRRADVVSAALRTLYIMARRRT